MKSDVDRGGLGVPGPTRARRGAASGSGRGGETGVGWIGGLVAGVGLIRAWLAYAIMAGVPLTGLSASAAENGSGHWAFGVPVEGPVPVPRGAGWCRGTIDRFVLDRMERAGLSPAPEADRISWIRRVTIDLTGLPPTPEAVEAFLADAGDGAHERVVEALLASPRHGERWAQHWLDVVRYADTHGFEVNTERPNAWPYRDYVIRALNGDTPYDRFVREQIVGDALGQDAATGFLVTASVLLPGQIGKDEPSIRLARQDALDEIVVNIGQTFLGLSVGCARCHDHKSDPISQGDYFSMQAMVAGVEYEDREMRSPEAEALRREAQPMRERLQVIERELGGLTPVARPLSTARAEPGAAGAAVESSAGHPLRPTVRARMNVDRFAPVRTSRVRVTIAATNSLEPCLDELEVIASDGRNVALAESGAAVATSGDTVVPDRHEPRFVNDGRYGNSRSWMSNTAGRGWVEVTFARDEEIERVVWGRDREGVFEDRLATDYRIEAADTGGGWRLLADSSDRRPWIAGTDPGPTFVVDGLPAAQAEAARRLLEEKATLDGRLRLAETGQLAFAGKFRAPDRIHLLNRGDPEQPRDEVAPATLAVLGRKVLPPETPEQERRRALAEWIASPANPLTARVMVNRLWQGHFGTGLVDTPSDFGQMGAPPTHPELLDWLALEFIRSGWSMKHMHRLIVLSAVYRQNHRGAAADGPDSAALRDAQARDAEARLLWRFPSRRVEAEVIRDSMLAASGRLDLRPFGRGFDLFDQRGGLSGFKPVESFTGDGLRRMIYAHKVRREREAVFGAFDCPDAGQSTARRRESTTPIQALNLFNSRFTLDASEALATRAIQEAGPYLDAQVVHLWRLVLARPPSPPELAAASEVAQSHGLAPLGRALLNSNEFLFLP